MLGGFRVSVGDQLLSDEVWRRRKARQLFKCLLSRPHYRLSKDQAVELLWPDSDSEAAAVNLRSTVHAIRGALEASQPRGIGGLVVVDRESIRVHAEDRLWVDADAFEQIAMQARNAAEPLPLLEQASRLYAGDYLPEDLYEDWAAERREALKRIWADLEFALAAQYEQYGQPEAALRELQRLVDADHCNERAARELMRLLIGSGRRPDALRVFQRLEESLRAELGVDPSDELLTLRRQAGSAEFSLATGGSASLFACAYPFPEPSELIGRDGELARLQRILSRGRNAGQVVFLEAPAGSGKSAVVGALIRHAQKAGVLCLAGGCYVERGVVPLGPLHDALMDYLLAQPPDRVRSQLGPVAVDLAAFVPELRYHLNLPEAPPVDAASERMRQFGTILAFLRSLAEHSPVLLCLEDIHAADMATLQIVHYLARHTRRLPVVLVCTFRTDDTSPAAEPLARVVAALARERLAEQLRLDPLDSRQTARLTGSLLGGSISTSLSDWLHATTEGNPLFIEQLVLALREQEQIDQRDGMWERSSTAAHSLPTIINALISQRFERLSARTRETLAMAAVLGQAFDYAALLACLVPRAEADLLADLEDALGAQLVRETPTGYAFGHALLHESMYWSLSAPRRMLLHARAGEILEHLARDQALAHAPELARHFSLAGQSVAVRAKALAYSLEAGRRAAALFSHREALHHFTQASQLIETSADQETAEARLAALEGRGHAERELAQWLACIVSFRRVLELSDDPLRRARARGVIAYALQHTGDTVAAVDEADAGLAELDTAAHGPEIQVARLRLQLDKALPWFLRGRFGELLALGQQMLRVAVELDQPHPLNWAHTALGMAHGGQGRIGRALEHQALALAAAERTGDKIHLAVTHESLGITCYRGGQFAAARVHLERALALYRESARDSRAVNTLQALGRLLLAEGSVESAREQAELACTLATEAHERWAAECHDVLASVHVLRAEWDKAQDCFEQSLRIRERVGHAAGLVDSLLGLGLVHLRRGEWQRAADYYHQAVRLATEMDPSPQAISARRHLGQLLLRMGDQAAASEQIERAVTLVEEIPESLEYAPALLAMADLQLHTGELTRGLQYAQRALAAGQTMQLTVELHALHVNLYLAANQPGLAGPHVEAAVQAAERLQSPYLLGVAELAAARAAAACGEVDHTGTAFDTALRWFEAAQTPVERALALEERTRAMASLTNPHYVGNRAH
jgi:DNA-binding SARP family transcriptional activator/tetratricopeptide (TPR) repeat protein